MLRHKQIDSFEKFHLQIDFSEDYNGTSGNNWYNQSATVRGIFVSNKLCFDFEYRFRSTDAFKVSLSIVISPIRTILRSLCDDVDSPQSIGHVSSCSIDSWCLIFISISDITIFSVSIHCDNQSQMNDSLFWIKSVEDTTVPCKKSIAFNGVLGEIHAFYTVKCLFHAI